MEVIASDYITDVQGQQIIAELQNLAELTQFSNTLLMIVIAIGLGLAFVIGMNK